MPARELNHSRVALPDNKALSRKSADVEVWNNTAEGDQPPHVVLTIEDKDGTHYVDLLPNEARAVAALLVAAAESQERPA